MATSLNDLPISPQTDNNIKLETSENVVINNPIQNIQAQRANDDKLAASKNIGEPTNATESSKDINQFVTGIQQAANAGALNLPSRDIPQQQVHITQDSSIQANYIPQNNSDYIGAGQSSEEIIRRNAHKVETRNRIDNLYDDFQYLFCWEYCILFFNYPLLEKRY